MNLTNETVNATQQPIMDIFVPTLSERISDLLTAPLEYTQMIYIVTPMVITLLLMEFYFGRYTTEELGWNTAVGNALVLIFVAVDLLKTTYPGLKPTILAQMAFHNITNPGTAGNLFISTIITIVIFGFGMLLLVTDFFHWLPKKLAFFISSSLPINLMAYIGIVLVYSNNTGTKPVPLDWYTLAAAVCLFMVLLAFFWLVHLIEPKAREKILIRPRESTKILDEEEAKEEYEES